MHVKLRQLSVVLELQTGSRELDHYEPLGAERVWPEIELTIALPGAGIGAIPHRGRSWRLADQNGLQPFFHQLLAHSVDPWKRWSPEPR